MSKFVFDISNENYDSTTVENIFISEFMPTASGEQIKVYLYCLMKARSPKPSNMSLEKVAQSLLMSEKEVIEAIHYWERFGIMSLSGPAHNQKISVNSIIDSKLNSKSNPVRSYEDNFALDKATNDVIFHVEKMLKAPPPFSYKAAIENWLKLYQFDPETIVLMMEYGLENMKGSPTASAILKYVKKIADDWYERGIRTKAEAQDHLKKHRYETKLMYRVLRSLGIYNRGPMEHERRVMRSWFDNLHFEETMILEAVGKSKVSDVNYVDGILKNWYQNGWKSPKDIVEGSGQAKGAAKSQPTAISPGMTEARIEDVKKAEDDFLDIYADEIAELEAASLHESGSTS